MRDPSAAGGGFALPSWQFSTPPIAGLGQAHPQIITRNSDNGCNAGRGWAKPFGLRPRSCRFATTACGVTAPVVVAFVEAGFNPAPCLNNLCPPEGGLYIGL